MTDVLACVDFSDLTDQVVHQGAALATAFGHRLQVLHVAAGEPDLVGYDPEDLSGFTRDDRAHQLEDERAQLRALVEPLQADGLAVAPRLAMGPTVERILEHATAGEAAFLVVGSHGHGGLRHLLLGSVTDALVRASPVPVLVVPASAPKGSA